jgi:hypothetical protein
LVTAGAAGRSCPPGFGGGFTVPKPVTVTSTDCPAVCFCKPVVATASKRMVAPPSPTPVMVKSCVWPQCRPGKLAGDTVATAPLSVLAASPNVWPLPNAGRQLPSKPTVTSWLSVPPLVSVNGPPGETVTWVLT